MLGKLVFFPDTVCQSLPIEEQQEPLDCCILAPSAVYLSTLHIFLSSEFHDVDILLFFFKKLKPQI